MFQAKLPARKFKSYVCTSTAAMAKAGLAKEMELEDTVHVETASKV